MAIKVVYKKLGKQKAMGIAHSPEINEHHKNLIELDPRLKGKTHLEILIHETLHIQNPDWSETKVIEKSKEMAKVLWSQQYRRIDNSNYQKKF